MPANVPSDIWIFADSPALPASSAIIDSWMRVSSNIGRYWGSPSKIDRREETVCQAKGSGYAQSRNTVLRPS